MREYIVTCKSHEDLDNLYDDMETPGGNLYIPDREVELVNRRPISRNTHYRLTAEEAEQVANDPRVIACELTPEERGLILRPLSYVNNQSYTISSASTWEKKELTFDGDTTGTLDNDNASSLRVQWWLGAGSDFTSGTLQTTWATRVNADRAVGVVNLADSTSNEWYITGCQLEVGSKATDFEFEPYLTTLTKCTRYLHKITNVGGTNFAGVGAGVENNSTQAFVVVPHITPMREQPSMNYSALSDFDLEYF